MFVNREKLSELLGCSLRTVDEYRRQGMPGDAPKRPGDQWRFETSAVVTWLRDRERQNALGEIAQIDESEAKRRKVAAEAALVELDLAKAQGSAVAISDFSNVGSQAIGASRAKLLGLGAKLGRQVAVLDDPSACAVLIDGAVNEALQELSQFEASLQIDPRGEEEPAAGSTEGDEPVGAATGPDRQRMGRRGATTQQRKQR